MSNEPANDAKRYNLFSRDGTARFVVRLKDEGIAIEADALVLHRAGQWTRAQYADIVAVTFSSGVIGRSNTIGSCTIEFGDGGRAIVSNVNDSGLSDGVRDGVYRRFVDDFHKQLIAAAAVSAITFHSGFSQARMNGVIFALVLATGFCLLLPLVLLLITHDLRGLWILLVGAGLVFPLYRIAGANQPGSYNPGAPPDLLP